MFHVFLVEFSGDVSLMIFKTDPLVVSTDSPVCFNSTRLVFLKFFIVSFGLFQLGYSCRFSLLLFVISVCSKYCFSSCY